MSVTSDEIPQWLERAADRMGEISGYPAWSGENKPFPGTDPFSGMSTRPCLRLRIPAGIEESAFRDYHRNPKKNSDWPDYDFDAEEQLLLKAAGLSSSAYNIKFPAGGRVGEEFAYIELVAKDQASLELALDDFSAGAMNRALRAAVRSLVLKGRPRNVVSGLSCPGAGAAYDTAYDEAGDNYDEDWITGRSVELCPALADQYRLIQAVGDNFNPRWRNMAAVIDDPELPEDIRALLFRLIPAADPALAVADVEFANMLGRPAHQGSAPAP